MTTATDLATLRAIWVQAHADELAAFDAAAAAPTATDLTAVRDRIARDLVSVYGQLTNIASAISAPPPPPPVRSVTATLSKTDPGRVDLLEVGFTATDRRRDGGTPNAGDAGWSGAIVGGLAPGRELTYLQRPADTTYVVGMKDAVKADWVSTSVKVPGSGSVVVTPPPAGSLLGAFGVAAGGGNDQPAYAASVVRHWTALTGKTVPQIRYLYVEADPMNPALLESVMGFWTSDPDVKAGKIRPHVRLSMGNSANPCAAVKNGSISAGMAETGAQLARLYAFSGIPPRVALAWEWNGWWFSWACGGGGVAQVWEGGTEHTVTNTAADFIASWRRSTIDLKAKCPQALLYLNGGVGCDGGQGGQNERPVNMSLSETVMQGLKGTISGTGTAADGQRWVDGFGGDLYNDGWWGDDSPGKIGPLTTSSARLAYLLEVLAANAAFCAKWGLPWGMQELGVADPAHAAGLIDADPFIRGVLGWMASLPALDHFLLFDVQPVTDYTGYRGFSYTPTVGTAAVLAALAVLTR